MKNCQNLQWDREFELPLSNISDIVEIEVLSAGLVGNTKLGEFRMTKEELNKIRLINF